MSEWPEPQPEPGETAQRWVIGVLAVGAVALLWNAQENSDWRTAWRMPEFSLPQLSMPDISMPDFDLPDLAQSDPQTQTSDVLSSVADSLPPGAPRLSATPQPVPYETCIEMLTDMPSPNGQLPIIEDIEDGRLGRIKLLEGNLTMICSRSNDTLTIETP